MIKHESTRSDLKAVRRANRAERLHMVGKSRESKRMRVSKRGNGVRPSYRSATCDCMFEREPDGTINFLGRASECPGILQGDVQNAGMGSTTAIPNLIWEGVTATSTSVQGVKVLRKKTPIEILMNHLKHMTAAKVLHYLKYTFKQAHRDIYMNNCETSPEILLSDLPGLGNMQAQEIAPIQFWGGPPYKRKMYTGTMLTLLLDEILSSNNPEIARRFLTV